MHRQASSTCCAQCIDRATLVDLTASQTEPPVSRPGFCYQAVDSCARQVRTESSSFPVFAFRNT